MFTWFLPLVRLLFCFLLISLLIPKSLGQALPAPQTGNRVDWEGPVRVAVEDDFTKGTSRTRTWIELAGQPLEVHFAGATPALISGQRVKLRGVRHGSGFTADLIDTSPAVAGPTPPCNATGELKVAVVFLEFPGRPLLPETLTASEVRDAFFAPTGVSANTYLREASYGKLSVSGDVYGPIQLDRDYDPATYYLYFQDFVRVADATVDFRNYNRIAFVWPTLPGMSGLTGEGQVGCMDLTSPTKGKLTGSMITVLPGTRQPFTSVAYLAAHELGHTLGLAHANTVDYAPSVLGASGSKPVEIEYGDPFSLMGGCVLARYVQSRGVCPLGQFSASHKFQLGWLSKGSNVQDIEAAGTFHLQPLEQGTTGLQAIHVRRQPQSNEWLWIEYRQPVGFDEPFDFYGIQALSGVLIHYDSPSMPGYDPNHAYLLDFTASTTPHDFTDSALAAGKSWSDPSGPLSIRVGNATPSGIDVTIGYSKPCVTLTPPSRDHGPSAETGSIAVSGSSTCVWTATTAADWISIASGQSGAGIGTISYALTTNNSGPRTGVISIGGESFTINQSFVNAAPALKSAPVAGSSVAGSTMAQTFDFTFSDANGGADIRTLSVLFQAGTNTAGACYIEYNRVTNTFRIADDSGAGWSSAYPAATTKAFPANSQCTLWPHTSDAHVAGNDLLLHLSVAFSAAFAGTKDIYLAAEDTGGSKTGWQPAGSWTLTANRPPTVLALTPRSGSGLALTMTATVSDPDGVMDIGQVQLKLVGKDRSCIARFYFYWNFDLWTSRIELWTNETGWDQIASLGYCAIDASKATTSASGNQLTVSLPFVLRGDFGTGANIKATVIDWANAAMDFYPGNWTLPANSCGYSLSPSSSSAASPASAGTLAVHAADGCAWIAATANPWIVFTSPATGSGDGAVQYSLIENLGGQRIGTIEVLGQTVTITQAGLVNTPPRLAANGIVNGASFKPEIASGSWFTILGSNLSLRTRIWQPSDFLNGLLPIDLDGVSITVNDRRAFIYYISPTQINALAPDDDVNNPGWGSVQVRTPLGTSDYVSVKRPQFSPAFFPFEADNRKYVAGVYPDGTYLGKVGLLPGLTSRPARPGDTILLFGTGFGATSPATPSGALVSAPAQLANTVTIRIGNVIAPWNFAGLVGSGLYQFNVTVPDVPDGDQALVADIGGFRSPDGLFVSIQH